jgi:hypothetical protein
VGKWTERLHAKQQITDKTDNTHPDRGLSSVSSVNRADETPQGGGFVSFDGESRSAEPETPARSGPHVGGPPLADFDRLRIADKTDETRADAPPIEDDEAELRRPGRPIRRPPPPTDPGAYCAVHKRLLTYREQMAGVCSWCSGAVQLDRPARAPAPRTCLECHEPLPAGNRFFCWGCVAARAGCADREVPY